MLVIVRVFRDSRWIFVQGAFLDLLPSCLHLHCSLQKSCSVSHYALTLLTPLRSEKQVAGDGRQSGPWPTCQLKVLANGLDFASANLFYTWQGKLPRVRSRQEQGCEERASPWDGNRGRPETPWRSLSALWFDIGIKLNAIHLTLRHSHLPTWPQSGQSSC